MVRSQEGVKPGARRGEAWEDREDRSFLRVFRHGMLLSNFAGEDDGRREGLDRLIQQGPEPVSTQSRPLCRLGGCHASRKPSPARLAATLFLVLPLALPAFTLVETNSPA